jgi:pectate disaccharide-lyase
MDLMTAINLPCRWENRFTAGEYPRSAIPLSASGSPDKVKTLQADGKAVIRACCWMRATGISTVLR